MKPHIAIFFSGLLWLAIGISLFYKGIGFLSTAPHEGPLPLQYLLGSSQAAGSVWMCIALLIGFLKGRFVFRKTVQRVVQRICSLPLPLSFRSIYPPSYWGIIGTMALLGMSLRFCSISFAIRGFIDIAVGFALFNGALLYFQAAQKQWKTEKL